MSFEYGLPEGENELDALDEILGQSFGHPEEIGDRFPKVGMDNLRVLRDGKKVAGGLWLIPMGHWFGGKSVPMTGVAAVGVDPGQRGRGVGLALMNRTIEELHQTGVPISALYPATQTLYRHAGYEQAGGNFLCSMAPGDIRIRDHSHSLRRATEKDKPGVRDAYNRYAVRMDGHLDRGNYIWDRVFEHRGKPTTGYVVEADGQIEGFVYYLHKHRDLGGYELLITDLVATTADAGRSLLSFLADARSMSPRIQWSGGPASPLHTLLPELPYEMKLRLFWMVRIINVRKALETRGYPEQIQARLEMEIQDELLPANNRRFVLEVEGGKARVSEGGKGRIRIPIRGLAPLYSGFLTPPNLAAAGLVTGDPAALKAATGIFAGATPSMPDMF